MNTPRCISLYFFQLNQYFHVKAGILRKNINYNNLSQWFPLGVVGLVVCMLIYMFIHLSYILMLCSGLLSIYHVKLFKGTCELDILFVVIDNLMRCYINRHFLEMSHVHLYHVAVIIGRDWVCC